MRRRVAAARVAHMGTIRTDGRPHVVVLCFVLEGDVIYSAIDAKPKSTSNLMRLDNVRSNPGVELLVDHYEDDWTRLWWVRVGGTGRVVEQSDHGLERLVQKYDQYKAQPPAGPFIEIITTTWRGWEAVSR